jgi:hypothetical protein
VQFDTLECVSRTRCQIEDQRLIEAAAAGLLPLMEGDDLRLVVAPRGAAARRLTQLIQRQSRAGTLSEFHQRRSP